jgi:hypothetical protein
MNVQKADEILRDIFDVVISEARANPAFARRMLAALPVGAIVELRTAQVLKQTFDPGSVNPVKILRESGDVTLRGTLDRLTKSHLVNVAKANHLLLSEAAKSRKATKDSIVDSIVEAANHRLKERVA